MNILEEAVQDSHYAFAEVISFYQEIKDSRYELTTMYLGPRASELRKVHERVRDLSKATYSDFVCDVELAALRALTDLELAHFNHYYKELRVIGGNRPFEDLDEQVMTKLGLRFIDTGVYPLKKYVSGKN